MAACGRLAHDGRARVAASDRQGEPAGVRQFVVEVPGVPAPPGPELGPPAPSDRPGVPRRFVVVAPGSGWSYWASPETLEVPYPSGVPVPEAPTPPASNLDGSVHEYWFDEEEAIGEADLGRIDPDGLLAYAYVATIRGWDDGRTVSSLPVLFTHVDDAVRWTRSISRRVQVMSGHGRRRAGRYYDATPEHEGPPGARRLPPWPG